MSSEKCKKCSERKEAWDILDNVKKTMEALDSMIYQATEAGFDNGRIYGLLEAASALEKIGQPELAKAMRQILKEDAILYGKPVGEA